MLAAFVMAQPPKPAESAPVVPLGRPGETTLYMMVRAGAHLSEVQLKNTLTRGLDKALCTIDGQPHIRQVSPYIFEELEAITSRTAKAVSTATPEHTVIRRLPVRDQGMWEFHLTSPSQVLKKLSITYKSAGKKEYTPVGPQEKGEVKLIVPGSYAVKLEPNDEPVSYEAEVVDLGAESTKMEGKWPAMDRCYVVTMNNFRGSRDRLFRIIQDPREVPNPLDSVRLGSDLVFVFANMDANAAALEGDQVSGNSLVVNVPAARNRATARVWMLFPLTESEMKAKLKELRDIKDDEKLAKLIRESSVKASTDHTVGPDTPPRWLELPDHGLGRSFRRVIPLRDFKGLLDKYPSVWRILVWEYDDGKPAAIQVEHPVLRTPVLAVEKDIKEWPTALRERLGSEKP